MKNSAWPIIGQYLQNFTYSEECSSFNSLKRHSIFNKAIQTAQSIPSSFVCKLLSQTLKFLSSLTSTKIWVKRAALRAGPHSSQTCVELQVSNEPTCFYPTRGLNSPQHPPWRLCRLVLVMAPDAPPLVPLLLPPLRLRRLSTGVQETEESTA